MGVRKVGVMGDIGGGGDQGQWGLAGSWGLRAVGVRGRGWGSRRRGQGLDDGGLGGGGV